MIPRSRSSGALSIWSNATFCASPFAAWIDVIAAVSVVFPWSTCPIVPTFTCGFVRSNLAFAMVVPFLSWVWSPAARTPSRAAALPRACRYFCFLVIISSATDFGTSS